jgi:hypothetical protein
MGQNLHLISTSVNPVHNAPRLSVTGPGVQADRARRGGWGRERSITERPGPALPDFDLTGPALPDFDRPGPTWGMGEGEVYYRQTRPDFSLACYFTGLSLPPPPKTSVTDTKTYWINDAPPHPCWPPPAGPPRPVLHRALPSPTPQNVRHRQTTIALIYRIAT